MFIEIERKYLAKANRFTFGPKHMPEDFSEARSGTPGDWMQRIEQGYVYVGKYAEVRIRRNTFADGHTDYKLALKVGNGFKRVEIEPSIPAKLYEALRPFAKLLRKTRYEVGGWSVDFFNEDLRGLVLAEHEEKHGREYKEPSIPAGLTLIRDVTAERTYANKNLARLSRVQRTKLARG